MPRVLRGAKGHFAGSIGDGRDIIPTPRHVTPAPVPPPDETVLSLTEAVHQFTSTMPVPGTNGTVYDITPGVIDEHAVAVFSAGQCHALARALHETTGWPVVTLFDEDCCYDSDIYHDDIRDLGVCSCQFNHVVVQVPDGRYLDITGLRTAAQLDDEVSWGPQRYLVDDGTVTAFLHGHEAVNMLRAPHMDAARSMVNTLLTAMDPDLWAPADHNS